MSRIARLLCAAVCATPSLVAAQAPVKSVLHDYRVVTVVDSLIRPWSMAFLPGGRGGQADMLVTEQPGRLRIVRGGKLLPNPVEGVPEVVYRGQGGLLDVVLHPDFVNNRLVYLSYSKRTNGDSATTAVGRGRFENDKLVGFADIFVADTKGGPGHFGSRLAFDRDGYLFITVGERMVPPRGDLEAHPAQDVSNHHGTVNRIHDDGRVPQDNPFVGKAGAKPEIWSFGHRNPQGLIIDPATNDVWATEHGPQGGDELNRIVKGLNYGWPVIGFGVNYGAGAAIHASTTKAGMEQPKHIWVPSIAVSGLMVYSGDKFPGWKGSVFAGGMAGEQLARIAIDGDKAELQEVLARRIGRIRDVRQGLDGFIYLAIDDRQGKPTPIVRLEPAR